MTLKNFRRLIHLLLFAFCSSTILLITNPAAADNAQFPFPLHVEAGTSSFHGGDQIIITDVRGTSPQFGPGNTYQIKGQYRLLNEAHSTLATAVRADNGSMPVVNQKQTFDAQQGDGDFTLILPFTQAGTPMVGFDLGGASLDSVNLITTKFPYFTDCKTLGKQLSPVDGIDIAQISCSCNSLSPGSTLKVQGICTLFSNGAARLAARLVHPGFNSDESQSITLQQAENQFAFTLPVSGPGNLELAILPNGSGGAPLGLADFSIGRFQPAPAAKPTFLQGSPDDIQIITVSCNAENTQLVNRNGMPVNYTLSMGNNHPLTNGAPTKFPYTLKFKTGLADFSRGDMINISKVEGTSPKIKIGGWYRITGSYDFHSTNEAYFAAYVTSTEQGSQGDQTKELPSQGMRIPPSGGSFTLILPVRCRGWPHVAIYTHNKDGNNWDPSTDWIVETRYFGTDDTILYKWGQKPPND
jgi:hypothetical protein